MTTGPAFSGATPDAGRYALPHPSGADESSTALVPTLDRTARAAGASVVSRLTASLAGADGPAVRSALAELERSSAPVVHAAATIATVALAGRLPALSGVTGPAAVEDDEEPDDLLRAYAQLLVSRAEPRRASLAPATSRAALDHVARTAAALAAAHLDPAAAAPGLTAAADLDPAAAGLDPAAVGVGPTAADPAADPDPAAGAGRAPSAAGPSAAAAAALLLAQTAQDGGGALAALDRELAGLVDAAGAQPGPGGAG